MPEMPEEDDMNEMPAIRTFQFQLHEVRLIDQDGEPWAIESDVKKILGLGGHGYSRSLLDREKGTTFVGTLGGVQRMNIISDEPTERAMREGVAYRHAWTRGTKSGVNLKWRVSFIDHLLARVREEA